MLPFLRLAKAQNPLPKFLHLIISPFLREEMMWLVGMSFAVTAQFIWQPPWMKKAKRTAGLAGVLLDGIHSLF